MVLHKIIDVPSPYNFGGTLGSLAADAADPCARIGHDEAWLTAHPPSGPVSLHLVHDASANVVSAEAFGPGSADQLESLGDLLGLNDRPEEFVAHHDVVRAGQRQSAGVRIPTTGWLYEGLVRTVFGQRVTTTEAHRTYRKFVYTYGEPAPGASNLRIFPRPETVAGLGYADFHPLGLERRRAETVINLAKRSRRLAQLLGGERVDLDRFLFALPGISHWSIGSASYTALGDPDAMALGDYHLPNHICWNLAGEPRGTDERMLELLEPYRGQRGRAMSYVTRGGGSAPKYGPRTRPQDISRY